MCVCVRACVCMYVYVCMCMHVCTKHSNVTKYSPQHQPPTCYLRHAMSPSKMKVAHITHIVPSSTCPHNAILPVSKTICPSTTSPKCLLRPPPPKTMPCSMMMQMFVSGPRTTLHDLHVLAAIAAKRRPLQTPEVVANLDAGFKMITPTVMHLVADLLEHLALARGKECLAL